MRFLLDTNTINEPLKTAPNGRVAEAAHWHATEWSRLVGLGQTPAFADGQIAAVAAVNSLVLVTRNVADFAAFQGLVIENWFEP